MKYAWIKEHRDEYSVCQMCRVLKLARSGYYKWLQGTRSKRRERSQRIRDNVAQLHSESSGILGSPKIAKEMHSAQLSLAST